MIWLSPSLDLYFLLIFPLLIIFQPNLPLLISETRICQVYLGPSSLEYSSLRYLYHVLPDLNHFCSESLPSEPYLKQHTQHMLRLCCLLKNIQSPKYCL